MFVACFLGSQKEPASMIRTIRRREFIAGIGAGIGAGLLAAPAIVRATGEPIVIRAGALKLIHSIAPYFYDQFVPSGYKVEVLPFETPTECKNAVVTKSVDFGAFGIAAALLGAAAGEPVVVIASTCNRGMAIIAKKDSGIATIKDLRGKRVAVFPGTTQEVFFLERLRMEGMTIRDVEPVQSPSPRCIFRWRAATSTPMSAPSPAPACRCRQASANWLNIRIRRRWDRSTWCSAPIAT
jgi:ABC-type nitrate/sulfonate/bicarbonate transport system substrate-binding protein